VRLGERRQGHTHQHQSNHNCSSHGMPPFVKSPDSSMTIACLQ
jgi:hypothetical protein